MLRRITNFAKSDSYREKIHSLIPGGSHTYSKGDDQFPLRSPGAILKGKNGHVWDVDGNEYLDTCLGLGSVTLGHAYEPVMSQVVDAIKSGVNFQRPSFLEMQAAEAYLSVIPGHDMIKFGKNGSTVTTAAVKLARAFTRRTLIAFPGDHPFYSYDDWFIGKTNCSRGVPEEIKKLSVTFKSYDLQSLEDLFSQYPGQIAGVITEPEKFEGIPKDYLKQAIDLCHKNGALFIADEMVSGFKAGFPGTCTKYGVTPDMSTWGKGMANGFSLCALSGKKEVMELGGIRKTGEEKVFLISSTHGGETHALAAGIATVNEFKTKNVIGINQARSVIIENAVEERVNKKSLSSHIRMTKNGWIPVWGFHDKTGAVSGGLRTLFLQEMIARGVLFQGYFMPTFSNDEADLEYFIEAFTESMEVYERALDIGWEKLLVGEPTKAVFRKLI